MRSLLLWLAAALLGCASRLDESALTRGAADDDGGVQAGSAPLPPPWDASAPPPDAPGPALAIASCETFAAYADGASAPDWTDGNGDWRVDVRGTTHLLRQESDPSRSHPERFTAWNSAMAKKDLLFSALVTFSDHECVLVRYLSAANNYELCLDADSGDTTPHHWELARRQGGSRTQLASGDLADPTRLTHALALKVVGATLTPMVDGVTQAPVTDTTFSNGAIAVSSLAHGEFTMMCVGAP
jgi:hypothetical protein